MEENYTAIILKKRKIGETDRLYTFYTREAGKMQSIGRGIRKPHAKLAGHLETLNQSALIVARRKGLGNIAGALTEKYFLRLKENEVLLSKTLEAIAIFERLVDIEEKDEALFDLLRSYVETMDARALENEVAKGDVISAGFLFRFLSHLGYRAQMHRCALSGEPLSENKTYVFSPEIGGVAWTRAAVSMRSVIPLSSNAIKLIRVFLHYPLDTIAKLEASAEDARSVLIAARSFARWIDR